MKRPKIRKLVPEDAPDAAGAEYVVSDPLGLAPGPIRVKAAELAAMRLMNGKRTAAEIAEILAGHAGAAPGEGEVAALAGRLAASLMLDCAASRKAYGAAQSAYRAGNLRRMRHSGESYPGDPAEFDSRLAAAVAAAPATGPAGRIAGLFAPHIDISMAWPVYAAAYAPLSAGAADITVFILGTAHFRDVNLFMLTEKDFETPFGRIEVDRDMAGRLARAFGGDLSKDELIHAHEHSVEFQAVFLHALLRARRSVKIVPVLVSSFGRFLDSGRRPSDDPLVSDFVAAADEALGPGREAAVVAAGVDMAHVGLKFGDDRAPDSRTISDLERADGRTLSFAAAADAEGFWDDIASDWNARRVCGIAPMYVALRLLEGCRGRTVAWGRDWRPGQGYAVTYAGVVFTRGE